MTYATSVAPDRPAHPRSLIRVYTVRHSVREAFLMHLANSLYPFWTAYVRNLVRIYIDRKVNKPGFVVASHICSHMCRVTTKCAQMRYATSVAPDQPAHPRSLIRVYTVRYFYIGPLIMILTNSL
jgi:hypothetical protein